MSRTIHMELSQQGVMRAMAELSAYSAQLLNRCDELCERLANAGVEASVAAITRDDTGQLRSSIRAERRGEREFVVLCDCGYAAYVEYGTGAVGAEGSYPGTYPEGISGPNPEAGDGGRWTYYDERQGNFVTTSGQVPQAFMAHGAESMRSGVMRIAREVFAA